jgi:ELWxxDGT repeat protein
MVSNIRSGSSSSSPGDLVNVSNTLFFRANDGTSGDQLWKSDGTVGNAVRVKSFPDTSLAITPRYSVNVGGVLYFSGNDGTEGEELWKSDGSETGTVLVQSFKTGSQAGFPRLLTEFQNSLFFTANGTGSGWELWASDGPGGSLSLLDLVPGAVSSFPGMFTNVNGTLYFSTYDQVLGDQLWKCNGTVAGTVLVKTLGDLRIPLASTFASGFTEYAGKVFFQGAGSDNALELWSTDSTRPGTKEVIDLNPNGNGGP